MNFYSDPFFCNPEFPPFMKYLLLLLACLALPACYKEYSCEHGCNPPPPPPPVLYTDSLNVVINGDGQEVITNKFPKFNKGYPLQSVVLSTWVSLSCDLDISDQRFGVYSGDIGEGRIDSVYDQVIYRTFDFTAMEISPGNSAGLFTGQSLACYDSMTTGTEPFIGQDSIPIRYATSSFMLFPDSLHNYINYSNVFWDNVQIFIVYHYYK